MNKTNPNASDELLRAQGERDIDLTYAIAAKIGEFYPTSTPRDLEKNHRLARSIQTLFARQESEGSAATQVDLTTLKQYALHSDGVIVQDCDVCMAASKPFVYFKDVEALFLTSKNTLNGATEVKNA